MRVDPPLTFSGSFWLPASPDRKLPGTVRIEDGGKTTLEMAGRLDPGPIFNVPQKYERVVGEVIQHGYVTLEKCIVTRSGYHSLGAP